MPRILGVDYGTRRVGFAVSDPGGIIAMPLKVADICGETEALREVVNTCRETQAERLVIGIPVNMDGTHGPSAEAVLAFIERLKEDLRIPILTWDERLSTSMVERVLLQADVSRAKRKAVRDKLAAQVILQGYLDSMPPAGGMEAGPGPDDADL
jgi:putative holliday junction resolvase